MPYYNGDPKRDHNFGNHLYGVRVQAGLGVALVGTMALSRTSATLLAAMLVVRGKPGDHDDHDAAADDDDDADAGDGGDDDDNDDGRDAEEEKQV